MTSDDAGGSDCADDDSDGRDSHTVELSARVYEHVQSMGMPDESASDTLARLLGLTPDPATVAGDEFSTPLPDDPVVPDALASDPATETAAVDPADVPEPATAPADVEASLGELADLLPENEDRAELEALLAEIADADPEKLEGIVASLEDESADADVDGESPD